MNPVRSIPAALSILGACLLGAACASNPGPGGPIANAIPGARLLVQNLTDYEWRIAVAAKEGGDVQSFRVRAHDSGEIALAGGDYLIDQTALPAGATSPLTRRVSARLEPGRTYRWRLGTLLSDPATEAGAPRR